MTTTPFAEAQVLIAEEAVDRKLPYTSDVGSVTSVETGSLRAMVQLDGSGVSMECLVGNGCHPIPDDRVAIQLFGAQWVIMTVLNALRGLGESGITQAMGTGTAPNGSWGDIPGDTSFQFVKRWDMTRVRWDVQFGCFTTVLGSTIQSGITHNGGSTTLKTGQYTFANNGGDPALDAHSHSGWLYSSGIPAGTYTVEGRWRSDANIQATADDWVSVSARELI